MELRVQLLSLCRRIETDPKSGALLSLHEIFSTLVLPRFPPVDRGWGGGGGHTLNGAGFIVAQFVGVRKPTELGMHLLAFAPDDPEPILCWYQLYALFPQSDPAVPICIAHSLDGLRLMAPGEYRYRIVEDVSRPPLAELTWRVHEAP